MTRDEKAQAEIDKEADRYLRRMELLFGREALMQGGHMITEPGIYGDMSSIHYYADPCPAPSFTQSLAKILLEKSPLHAWHAHPRLNPDYRERDGKEPWLDIGNIAHSLLLGRGKHIVVLDGFDDWRKKEAQEKRAGAANLGQLAVLPKHFAKASAMAMAARAQLTIAGLENIFSPAGDAECCLIWKEGDLWLRQLLDWLSHGNTIIADYKTTGESAAPHGLGRKMASDGWPIQAAMAERGLDVLSPKTAGRREYLFVLQESDPPYSLTISKMGEGALTIGRKMLDHAITQWALCLSANRFPGYPPIKLYPAYPGYVEDEWLRREIEHDERRTREPMVTELG